MISEAMLLDLELNNELVKADIKRMKSTISWLCVFTWITVLLFAGLFWYTVFHYL